MKKSKIFIAIAMLLLCLVMLAGCSSTTDYTSSTGSLSYNTNTNTSKTKTLKLGDTWVVDGQWKLTINSVVSTYGRNQFADTNPEQVVLVTYTYENIGYEDQWGIMDGLYFDLEPWGDATVIDEEGELADSYPGDTSKYPQETPVGAKCSNVQSCIGLTNRSDTITMNISKYDGNGTEHKVTYVLDVD